MADEIDYIDEKERELFARAQLSEQVKDFLVSPVGRYLHGRARQEVEQAQVDALECNVSRWWGRRKFNNLQQKAERARSLMRWLADAITDGEVAYQELRDYRREE
jgi:hypothetical protein